MLLILGPGLHQFVHLVFVFQAFSSLGSLGNVSYENDNFNYISFRGFVALLYSVPNTGAMNFRITMLHLATKDPEATPPPSLDPSDLIANTSALSWPSRVHPPPPPALYIS